MNRIDEKKYAKILEFVYENPDKYTAGQVAGMFGVSSRTMYRLNDRLALPLKTYQLCKLCRMKERKGGDEKERNEATIFDWRQYPEGVL